MRSLPSANLNAIPFPRSRWLAVRTDLAVSDLKLSDIAVANVDYLLCLSRKLAASTAVLLEEDEPNPKRVSILLAAMTADVDYHLWKN